MSNLVRFGSLLTAALALAACGGAGSATPSPSTSATPVSITVTLSDFKIEPSDFSAAGPLAFAVTSAGPTPHNLTLRDASNTTVAASLDLRTGESDSVEVPALAPGEYTLFCSFAGHESLGMRATLTIEP